MQRLPEFVSDQESEVPVRRAASASLTGWETVIFQLAAPADYTGPEEEPEPGSESAFSTAAFAP
jgi:hypothetical protein